MRCSILSLLLLAIVTPVFAADDADLLTLKRRIRQALLAGPDRQALIQTTRQHLQALRPDGSWPDVDYADRSRAHWKPQLHLVRLRDLAKARHLLTPTEDHPWARDLKDRILLALDYWLKRDPRCDNWWYNQIGAPTLLGDILILIEEELTPQRRAAGIDILKRSTWKTWTGQNLVWGTSVQVIRGCIDNSPATVAEAYRRMYDEIRIAPPGHEGIQADFSFHQHGPLLYSGGYGAAFTYDCARFIHLARETAFAPPPGKLRLLENYVLDHQQWTIRGTIFDYSVTGRELTRPGKSATPLLRGIDLLADLPGPRQSEFAQFARRLRRDSSTPLLAGNRHFWKSDYMVHHRPAYFASVRMFSERLLNTDGYINGENKKSHHLADGVSYLYLTGDEYRDIFPVWNWHRIPGTTIEQNTPLIPEQVCYKGATSFVGGASDGTFGLAAMHLKSNNLSARKAWFFFDDLYACLGSAITCPTDNRVVTTLNQCLLQGPVSVALLNPTRNQPWTSLSRGSRSVRQVRWVHHNAVTYLFPDAPTVHISNQPQTGSWSSIGAGPADPVTQEVFTLCLDHGPRPDNTTYQYIIAPNTTPQAAATLAVHLPLAILSNTPTLQAVHHPSAHLLMAAFHTPGTLRLDADTSLCVDRPCLLLLRQDADQIHLTLSNPENQPLTVHVTLNGLLAAPLRFDLPAGPDAGRSLTRTVLAQKKTPGPRPGDSD